MPSSSQFLIKTRTAESGQAYDVSLRPEHLLGHGQFSVGVRIAHPAGKTNVAPHAAKELVNEKQARREFQVHQDLASHPAGRSPYLVRAFDIAVSKRGSSHLFMECFSGPDGEKAFAQVLQESGTSGRHKAETILSTARQYVIALGELHRRGYQHGDTDNLKNFFSEGLRVALGDYGSSRKLGSPDDAATLEQLEADRFGLGMMFSRMHRTAEEAGIPVRDLRVVANTLMAGMSSSRTGH